MGCGSRWVVAATLVMTSTLSAGEGPGRTASVPGAATTGLWSVSSTPSKTAGPTLVARLSSDGSVVGSEPAELVLRCRARVFDVYVDTKVIASGVGNRVRWDDAPAQAYDVWSDADSNPQTLFTPEPEEFLRKAMKARRLRFEFTPPQGGPAVASFKLAGISGVVIRLQQACPTLVALH